MAIKQNKLNANDEVVVSDDLKMTDGVPNNSDVAALFTSANTSLVGTIDGELPIPLEAKTGDFTAEDAHAYAVTMSAGITLTFPTVPSGNTNALIFQARFSNGGDADLSVTFNPDGQTVKFDGTDCGVVKAGKSALLSAMWNGAAWDLVWKNQA